ncbi:MAG: C/D box methylation guide ribonucleoprotein complex aNOP56 subunit, partial [Candidatus Bathyarchaeia archaeon]
MNVTVVCTPIGLFALDEGLQIVEYTLYSKSPSKVAEAVDSLSAGKLTKELEGLLSRLLESGYRTFLFEEEGLARSVSQKMRVESKFVKGGEAGNHIRKNLDKIASETGFLKEGETIRGWVREVTIELSRIRVRKAMEKRDELVVKSIQTIDDLEKTSNLLVNRLREWYGLHFPELDSLVSKNETYVKLVDKLGDRSNFTFENLTAEGVPTERARNIAKSASSSIGAHLKDEDVEQMRKLSSLILSIEKVKETVEKYTDSLMGEVSPNVTALVGPLIGARLISIAGGLENLAKMPSSTIQVLGAEKALFRSLKTGNRPPKHGVIFQHKLLREAK